MFPAKRKFKVLSRNDSVRVNILQIANKDCMFNKYVRIMYDEEIDLIANYHTSGRGIGMAPKDYHLSLYIFTLKPGIPLFLYQNNMHFRKMNDKFILR